MLVEINDFDFLGMSGKLKLKNNRAFFETLDYDPTKDFRSQKLAVAKDQTGKVFFTTAEKTIDDLSGLIEVHQVPDNLSPYLTVRL